jgi:hypothetical protein
MPDDFKSGSDWEQSSGPIIARQFAAADLWPHGLNSESDGAGDKDILADGLHPVLAIGADKTNRPRHLTGVVMTYTNANLVTLNLADKFVVRNYVANIVSYGPTVYDQSMAIGEPVYVDDSTALSSGVTLSRSPNNNLGAANPLAGYLYYCQDEFYDSGVGGANAAAVWPKVLTNELHENEYCIMLVNDFGDAVAIQI